MMRRRPQTSGGRGAGRASWRLLWPRSRGNPAESAESDRYVGIAYGAEAAGPPWREHLVPGSGLAVMLGLLAAAQAECQRAESEWRRVRMERWRSFCSDEMAGGGGPLFQLVRGPPTQAPPVQAVERPPSGTLAGLAGLDAGLVARRLAGRTPVGEGGRPARGSPGVPRAAAVAGRRAARLC